MIDLFAAARQLQEFCDGQGWRSCFVTENRIRLRKAALVAAIAQALIAVMMIWPEVVGMGPAIPLGVPFWMSRSVQIFNYAALVNFNLVIFLNADGVLVARGTRRVALGAAILIAIQDIRPTLVNIRTTGSILWHPERYALGQAGAILLTLFGALLLVSMILVLIAIWRLSPDSSIHYVRSAANTDTTIVRAAALLAAAAAACQSSIVVYRVVLFKRWTLSAAIIIATQISFVCFFALMCKSDVVRTSAAYSPLEPAR